MARKSRQVETRFISEYLKEHYSSFSYILNIPLGKVEEDLMRELGYQRALGLTRPFRPRADAVVILPRHLILVEAKVWSVINGLAKLPLYRSLVPVTPELQQYLPRGIICQLVVAWTNPNLERMAREADVSLKVYRPPWIQEIVDKLHLYDTKEYREKREAKLRMREHLGIE